MASRKSYGFILAWLLLTAAQSPTPVIINIAPGTYSPNVYPLASTAVPAGISTATLLLDRTSWTNPAVVAVFQVDLSGDGGNTWITNWCTFSAKGGTSKIPGLPPQSKLTCQCTPASGCNPASSTNRVRGSVTISGGNLVLTNGGSLTVQ